MTEAFKRGYCDEMRKIAEEISFKDASKIGINYKPPVPEESAKTNAPVNKLPADPGRPPTFIGIMPPKSDPPQNLPFYKKDWWKRLVRNGLNGLTFGLGDSFIGR